MQIKTSSVAAVSASQEENQGPQMQVLINSCLRKILNIHWPDNISSSLLWRGQTSFELRRKLGKDGGNG
ncbi:unnamed protein product [Schistosoma margrebowiei]|uniref:Uncharacterized protein n=1 Tax=Schistosoma margrebowiei TaxID=48269 RepID=A0A183M8E9_9TREM|nr:unnamed protein product [Schistosoma margrebowiei]